MRHTITRIVVGIIWIIAGIVALSKGNVMGTAAGFAMGIAFIATGISMRKKSGKATK